MLQAPVMLFSNMWKQFMPSESIVIDKLIIPSMVDFDSVLVEVNSLQSYHTS